MGVVRKHFENGAFRRRVFLKHKSKMTCDCYVLTYDAFFQSETSVFKFLRRSVGGKHLIRFQSETSVFKFLWRQRVNGD